LERSPIGGIGKKRAWKAPPEQGSVFDGESKRKPAPWRIWESEFLLSRKWGSKEKQKTQKEKKKRKEERKRRRKKREEEKKKKKKKKRTKKKTKKKKKKQKKKQAKPIPKTTNRHCPTGDVRGDMKEGAYLAKRGISPGDRKGFEEQDQKEECQKFSREAVSGGWCVSTVEVRD